MARSAWSEAVSRPVTVTSPASAPATSINAAPDQSPSTSYADGWYDWLPAIRTLRADRRRRCSPEAADEIDGHPHVGRALQIGDADAGISRAERQGHEKSVRNCELMDASTLMSPPFIDLSHGLARDPDQCAGNATSRAAPACSWASREANRADRMASLSLSATMV